MPDQIGSPEFNKLPYDIKRSQEYPSIADFVDAIYWQQKGDNSKLNEWVSKCDAVKSKYPKSL